MKKNYFFILLVLCVFVGQSQTITTVAGNGNSGFSGDGDLATTAKLNLPFNLTFDKADNLFIADTYNKSIRKIDTESGIISTVVGTADKNEISELNTPTGLTFDNYNNLYIADLANARIRKVNLDTGSSITLVGKKSETVRPNIDAELAGPFNVVFDKIGHLYISNNENSKVSKVDFFTGEVTTIAGTGVAGFSGDGGPANKAQLANPTGLALDNNGHLFISDSGNERIRQVDLNTGIITTIAGNGRTGFSEDGVFAVTASLSNPLGLAVDVVGDLYFVDRNNNMVRKVDMTTGKLTTVAGNGKQGFSGDGSLATEAKLSNPTGLAFNKSGDLYIVDRGNNRIRKITGLIKSSETNIATNIKIFPNPSIDKINVEVSNDVQLIAVALYDSSGTLVKVPLINNSLNVSKLPRGIYILKITTSEGSSEQKVVLE
ncbi:T9SS type A sorting domain-containing protein [Flavobacteriaceae bacterium F08102]|nr:T9SS type A sorting domain-containing protein [Flavobacteriaceae bacterium F08102]